MPDGWQAPDPVGDLMGSVEDPYGTPIDPVDTNAGTPYDGDAPVLRPVEPPYEQRPDPRLVERRPRDGPPDQRSEPPPPVERRSEPLFF